MIVKVKNLYGLILAGGHSKRMGQDKALIQYHGKPHVVYTYDIVNLFTEKTFIAIRPEQSTQSPYNQYPKILDTPHSKLHGPLGAMAVAMEQHPLVDWLVVACDLPFMDQHTIACLIENQQHNTLATAFKSNHDGLPEPLCAVWTSRSYPSIKSMMANDIRCPRKVLMNIPTTLVNQRNSQWLENANSPEEYQAFLSQVKSSNI